MESVKNIIQMEKTLDSKPKCPICGEYKKPLVFELFGKQRIVYPMCECESKEYEKKKLENEILEKKRRLDKLFKQSRLGIRFKECSFENFKIRKGTEDAYTTTKKYADNFNKHREEGKGLLLSSIPGTGKTHLMAAITNQLVNNMTSVIFVVVPELLQQIRSTYGKGTQTEGQIMYGLAECDLLILDDIGAEKQSDWTMEKLFTVIDSRYRDRKPILFTTNCNSVELRDRLGDRTFSRIMEICEPLKLECDDYRLKAF